MTPSRTLFNALFLATASFCSAVAAEGIEPLPDAAPGNAGLGIALKITASPYLGGGARSDLIPVYLYEGERIFLHTNRAGVKLYGDGTSQDSQRFDAFVEQRLEGFASNKIPTGLAGVAARNSGTDFGLSYRTSQSWGTLRAELLRGVGGASRGTEAKLSYSYEWRTGPWSLTPNVSVSWRDAKLNDYYYGVRPNEAMAGRAAYLAGAGLQSQLRLYGSYDMSQRWRLTTGVSATLLSASVANSPIVQKRILPAIYVGAAYDFGSHKRPTDQAATPTYFKLLYGKATEDGCHLARIITARCLSTAKVNATNVVGVQLGKPFVEKLNGWPLDVVGYVGLTYHDERGLQPNGAQLDVFMKGFYYGFPWGDRVKTRLGLGIGLSAAQRVPYTEVLSQTGKTTSRMLSYLDPTIDVNVGDVFGAKSLKDTFVGFGVSHRSGVFGASRLLGNVSGGSNYIYTYVETAF